MKNKNKKNWIIKIESRIDIEECKEMILKIMKDEGIEFENIYSDNNQNIYIEMEEYDDGIFELIDSNLMFGDDKFGEIIDIYIKIYMK